MTCWRTFFALLLASLCPGVALAEMPRSGEPVPESASASSAALKRPSQFLPRAYLGALWLVPDEREHSNDWAGALLGAEAAYRYDYFAGAAFLQGGAGLSMVFASAGLAAGVGMGPTPGLRVDLLLGGGFDYYSWGFGFLSDDPGVTEWLPFVGPRFHAAYAFGAGRTHFEIGAFMAWETNPMRIERSYSYVETPWLCMNSCEPYTTEAHHVVGGSRALFALMLGIPIDSR